jgi:hypothetical protein
MAPLDLLTDPSFECVDDDSGDLTFVHVTSLVDGQDTVEEYLACGMFLLWAGFGFTEIADGDTPVSEVTLPLPQFHLAKLQGEGDAHFLERVELGV